MPKKNKKKDNDSNPESIKEQGNKAFMTGDYISAIKHYTVAIEITLETPSAIYYANRANAHLELQNYEECIADCNMAIQIDPTFHKSFYRRAKALWRQDKLQEAADSIKQGIELDPDNGDYRSA